MDPLAQLVGESPPIVALRETLRGLLDRHRQAPRLPPILLEGETGTGKGLLAGLIHQARRRAGPFVDVNCAAIPETLLEAELFGFERGAFTDARHAKPGLFQAANGGTLFLDEIGLLPEGLQAKLLKVLDERSVRRLGSVRAEPVDVQIIAATGRDLAAATAEGRFRADLYHRLAVLTLRLPPLRERGADVIVLAEHFLARACAEYGVRPKHFTAEAREALLAHSWPGNVRELSNVVERVALLTEEEAVTAEALALPGGPSLGGPGVAAGSLEESVRNQVLAALAASHGNITQAAARLGIARNTLLSRMRKYGLRGGHGGRTPPAAAPALVERRSRPAGMRWEARWLGLLHVELRDQPPASLGPSARLERIAQVITAYQGQAEPLGPGALVAVFGLAPAEDVAGRAAQAALAIAAAGADGVRMVIAVEQLLVGVRGGQAVIEAEARRQALERLAALAAEAEPRAILLGETAARLLERRFALAPASPGRPRRLLGAEPAGPSRTRFVGRATELALLQQALQRAREGRGQVVGVVGEPGVGKSRLVLEVLRSVPAGVRVLAAQGVPHRQTTPYYAVSDLLRRYFGVEERDDQGGIRERVAAGLRALDPALEARVLSPLLALLDVPADGAWSRAEPPRRRQWILDACSLLLLCESQRRPLVLVFEDLQWADSETQAVLDRLVDRLPAARIALVAVHRPEYRPPWAARSHQTQVRLDALPPDHAEELLSALVGHDPMLGPLKRLLIDRTEGNPFFLEEMVQTLVETGALAGHPGAYAPTAVLPEVSVPPTVQAVLAARVDRLPPEEKELLELASVIGRDVPLPLLRAVAGLPAERLRTRLDRLQAGEFIHEARPFPEPGYRFKHALTHDVVYQGLPVERRRELHARILDAMEVLHTGRLDEHVEGLARHAAQSGQPERAVRYLRQAAAKAIARSANHEAVASLRGALSALAELPATDERLSEALDIRLDLGPALIVTAGGGAPEVQETYACAQALCDRIGDRDRRFQALWGLWYASLNRGDAGEMRALAERLLAAARDAGDPVLLLEAHHSLWATRFQLGELPEARRQLDEGLRLYDPRRHRALASRYAGHDAGVCGRIHMSVTLFALGYPDQAARWSEDALGLARRLGHPQSMVLAHHYAAALRVERGEPGAAVERAEVAAELASIHGQMPFLDRTSALLGELWQGDDVLAWLAQALAAARRGGWRWRILWSLGRLAALAGEANQVREALAALSEALAEMPSPNLYEPELHRLQGALLERRGTPEAAEAAYRRAADLARARAQRSYELRAVTALARLLGRRGHLDEARRMLTDLHGWFTEGFETADLRTARTVLQEL